MWAMLLVRTRETASMRLLLWELPREAELCREQLHRAMDDCLAKCTNDPKNLDPFQALFNLQIVSSADSIPSLEAEDSAHTQKPRSTRKTRLNGQKRKRALRQLLIGGGSEEFPVDSPSS